MDGIARSLHLKIVLLVLSVLTLMFGVIFFVQYQLNAKHLTNSLKVSAGHLGSTLEKSFEIAMLSRRLDEVQLALEEIGREPQIERIFIVNKLGKVKVSSDRTELGKVLQISEQTCQVCHRHKPSDREESIIVQSGTERFLRNVNPILKKPVCGKCHLDDVRVLGVLVTDISVAEVEALADDNLRTSFILFVMSVLFMGGALRIGFKRIILDRIAQLRTAAGKMEKGDFTASVVIPTQDELGQLAGTFNRMAENLRRSLERIESARAYLEGLINSIDDGVAVIKRGGTFILVNDSYLRMFDRQDEDRRISLDASIGEINVFHGEWCQEEKKRCNICQALETGMFSNRVVTYHANDGTEKMYESYVSVITSDENGACEVVEDLRDITLRKKLESQMMQTEKLVSVGKLAAGVAHEINNPMASITTCAEGLMRMVDELQIEGDNKDDLYEYLQTIRSSAFRCKAITERLLNFSSAQDGEFELADINEVIKESVRLAEYDISAKGVSLNTRLTPGMPQVSLSRVTFPQVVVNLLLNSLYAVQRGGSIMLRTFAHDGKVFFEVEDDGAGIGSQDINQVFEPFFSTKKTGEGTGLGLSICRTIVDNHHGEIAIESKQNEGTKVTVTLPANE